MSSSVALESASIWFSLTASYHSDADGKAFPRKPHGAGLELVLVAKEVLQPEKWRWRKRMMVSSP